MKSSECQTASISGEVSLWPLSVRVLTVQRHSKVWPWCSQLAVRDHANPLDWISASNRNTSNCSNKPKVWVQRLSHCVQGGCRSVWAHTCTLAPSHTHSSLNQHHSLPSWWQQQSHTNGSSSIGSSCQSYGTYYCMYHNDVTERALGNSLMDTCLQCTIIFCGGDFCTPDRGKSFTIDYCKPETKQQISNNSNGSSTASTSVM